MRALCGVCKQQQFKYTCPRCEVVYCSLPCYQRHGSKCTESFYQQQVQEDLQSNKVSDDERKYLEQIVSQLNRLDMDPEDEHGDESSHQALVAEKRLEELVVKAQRGELEVQDLTEEEARSFHSEIKRGSLGRLLPAWQPWWQQAGIIELDPPCAPSSETLQSIQPCELPPHICCAEGRQPHASVAFTCMAAVYAYVHTMRSFNGEWELTPLEAASQLLHLCPAICAHRIYETAEECMRACLDSAAALAGKGFGAEFDLLCLTDASMVIRSAAEISTRVFAESIQLLETCLASGGGGRSGRLRRGVKKLLFLASFACHHCDQFSPMAVAIEEFVRKRKLQGQEVRQATNIRKNDGIALPERQEEH